MNTQNDYYEKYWSTEGFFPHGKIWPELRALYEKWIPPGASVLDVGCGDGQTSGKWLSENGRQYVGVDISANAVDEARQSGLEAIKIEDASVLPFDADSFDVVVCVEVLEHLFDPQRAIKNISRVLKPGGIFIATVPNTVYWRNRADFFLLGRWNPLGDTLSVKQPWRDPHIRFFTIPSMRRLILECDLSLLHIGGQSGGLLKAMPYVRKFSKSESSIVYRFFERMLPSLFGYRIEVVCRKPLN
jgi:methionine biosynthesis protein MetW